MLQTLVHSFRMYITGKRFKKKKNMTAGGVSNGLPELTPFFMLKMLKNRSQTCPQDSPW